MPRNRPTIADDLPGYINRLAASSGKETDWKWFDENCTKLNDQETRIKHGDTIASSERVYKKDFYDAMGCVQSTFDRLYMFWKIWKVQHDSSPKAKKHNAEERV